MHIVEIFLCYGLYSALCVCVCGEIWVIVILLYLERTSKKTGLPPKAMSVSIIVGVYLVAVRCMCDYVCVFVFSFQIFIQSYWGCVESSRALMSCRAVAL